MKKILSSILLSVLTSIYLCPVSFGQDFKVLPANTPVEIQLTNIVSSGSISAGDTIEFTVVKTVSVNGKEVIAAGTPAKATVQQAKKRSTLGKGGKLTIGDFYTTSVNGTKIPMTGEISEKGKSKTGLSVALSAIIIPFFLFMHGKDAQIDQGQQFTVYTTSNVYI